MRYLTTLIIILKLSLSLYSQDELPKYNVFKYGTYKGKIGNVNITMVLFFNDTIVDGYYYYDKIGKLFPLSGSKKGLKFKLEYQDQYWNPNKNENEFFEGKISVDSGNNYSIIEGIWRKNNKTLSLSLKRQNQSIEWKFVTSGFEFYSYDKKNIPQYESRSIIYPSKKTAPELNYSVLTLIGLDNNYIDFINSSKTNNIIINEFSDHYFSGIQYDDCWHSYAVGKVIFFNDSLVCYNIEEGRYIINVHYYWESYYCTFKISNGKSVRLNQIINQEYYDNILEILKGDYKDVFTGDESEPQFEISSYSIAPKGIYFHYQEGYMLGSRSFKLFIPYTKLKPYINNDYKYLINE